MLFNSIDFLIFLPIVFVIYWTLKGHLKWQNLFVVMASYVFYGWWDWHFLLLIFLTTFASWTSGILIEKFRNHKIRKCPIAALITISNIVLNVGILIYYKYYNFFIDTFIGAFSFFGKSINVSTLNIILPVGISFYTFQAISYTIDVYRKTINATPDIIAFFAFVSFFPQLVAGPIERATHLLPQFFKHRVFDVKDAIDGCKQMIWGFFKKMVVGDTCAIVVDSVYANIEGLSGTTLLLGAIFFSFQIYCDFSGYSDIAIGVSKLFGIKLMKNFDYPYFSRNISEFWRRWHISLQKWFTDYIYIPLGGSRGGRLKWGRNILIVFAVSGLWHGANWTFILWGLYHAVLMILSNTLGIKQKYDDVIASGRRASSREYFQLFCTFTLVTFGWILFRASSLEQAFLYYKGLFSTSTFTIPKFVGIANANAILGLIFVCIMLVLEWQARNREHPLYSLGWKTTIVSLVLVLLIYFFGVDTSGFIYFQF